MQVRRGPLFMILSTMLLVVMVAAVKVAREELATFDVMVWRCATSLPIAWLLAKHAGASLTIHNRRLMAIRCLLGFGAMTCFFTATRELALADVSILAKLQPILVALLAPLFLGKSEKPGPLIWGVLVVGIAGCTLIVGPGLAVGNVYGLWAVTAACFSAGAHVSLRALGRTESPYAIVLWLQAVLLVLAAGGSVATTGGLPALPPTHLWPWLAVIGVAAAGAQLLMTTAYKIEKASVVAAASYVAPLFAALGDLIVFGALPTVWIILGGALVVGAGLILVFSSPRPIETASEETA